MGHIKKLSLTLIDLSSRFTRWAYLIYHYPRPICWHRWFCLLANLVLPLDVVWNLTFFDLWPHNRRSDEEVSMDTFACLTKANMLAPLVLPFGVVWNLTFLWPLTLNRKSHQLISIFYMLRRIIRIISAYFQFNWSILKIWPLTHELWPLRSNPHRGLTYMFCHAYIQVASICYLAYGKYEFLKLF